MQATTTYRGQDRTNSWGKIRSVFSNEYEKGVAGELPNLTSKFWAEQVAKKTMQFANDGNGPITLRDGSDPNAEANAIAFLTKILGGNAEAAKKVLEAVGHADLIAGNAFLESHLRERFRNIGVKIETLIAFLKRYLAKEYGEAENGTGPVPMDTSQTAESESAAPESESAAPESESAASESAAASSENTDFFGNPPVHDDLPVNSDVIFPNLWGDFDWWGYPQEGGAQEEGYEGQDDENWDDENWDDDDFYDSFSTQFGRGIMRRGRPVTNARLRTLFQGEMEAGNDNPILRAKLRRMNRRRGHN